MGFFSVRRSRRGAETVTVDLVAADTSSVAVEPRGLAVAEAGTVDGPGTGHLPSPDDPTPSTHNIQHS